MHDQHQAYCIACWTACRKFILERDDLSHRVFGLQALESPHALLLHEEVALARHVSDFRRIASKGADCSLQASRPALAGIAAARQLPDVVHQLKQQNLKVCMHCGLTPICEGIWLLCSLLIGRCLLICNRVMSRLWSLRGSDLPHDQQVMLNALQMDVDDAASLSAICPNTKARFPTLRVLCCCYCIPKQGNA